MTVNAYKYPNGCPTGGAVASGAGHPVLSQFSEEFDNGNGFDMVFSIGTSAMFPYITAPVYEAIHCGKTTVEINPAAGELSHRVAYYLPMGAADALTRLDALTMNLRNEE